MTPQTPSADDEDLSRHAIDYDGAGLVNVSFAGTGLLLVAGAVGVASPDRWGGLTAVIAGGLFVVGVVGFLYGYAVGVVRSAEEKVGLAGLFFLSGTAPRVVRFRMRSALAAQAVIAAAVAATRPYTSVAFAVLAPMLGLGLMATWGARHGTFFRKDGAMPAAKGEDAVSTPLWILILGLEFPALLGFLDCIQRPVDHFAGGAADKTAWTRWLVVAIILVPIFVGYGILLGYYYGVIRRNMPGTPR